ncbi:hypothetical protein M0805_002081 [Coniferiporia weirii]|nr:hypothetical protein M0805_002081 [Coniferiporia weirii]
MFTDTAYSSAFPWIFDLSPRFLAAVGISLSAVAVYTRARHRDSNGHSQYHPSPPSDPIIGHLRIMPTRYQWKTFAEWGRTLGDVIYTCVLGRHALIINSAEVACELMERRGANFSDRPHFYLLGDVLGWGKMLTFLPYGNRFRTQRRLMQQYFNSQAVVAFRPYQIEEIKTLLKNLLGSPENFVHHINRMSTATLVMATYGHKVESDDDEYTRLAVDAASRASAAGVPGATLVDLVPFLRHMPFWIPGAGSRKAVAKMREVTDDMLNVPYNDVKRLRSAGKAVPSLMSRMLDEYEAKRSEDPDHVVNMKNVSGIIHAAGVDTSETALVTFFLMMTCYPDVAERAQAEIDTVLGSEHLPTLDDRPRLPYVECILKEVLRINPPLPLGIPHQSMKEDTYQDKTIPAGTLILPNVWQMARDERYFKDPAEFNPDRFLEKVLAHKSPDGAVHALNVFSADEPASLVFGFGRRLCPGRFFVDASLWMVVSNVLAAFNIKPCVDTITGKETKLPIEFTSGATSHPIPFKCSIVPRSEKHTTLINRG